MLYKTTKVEYRLTHKNKKIRLNMYYKSAKIFKPSYLVLANPEDLNYNKNIY